MLVHQILEVSRSQQSTYVTPYPPKCSLKQTSKPSGKTHRVQPRTRLLKLFNPHYIKQTAHDSQPCAMQLWMLESWSGIANACSNRCRKVRDPGLQAVIVAVCLSCVIESFQKHWSTKHRLLLLSPPEELLPYMGYGQYYG